MRGAAVVGGVTGFTVVTGAAVAGGAVTGGAVATGALGAAATGGAGAAVAAGAAEVDATEPLLDATAPEGLAAATVAGVAGTAAAAVGLAGTPTGDAMPEVVSSSMVAGPAAVDCALSASAATIVALAARLMPAVIARDAGATRRDRRPPLVRAVGGIRGWSVIVLMLLVVLMVLVVLVVLVIVGDPRRGRRRSDRDRRIDGDDSG